MNSNPTVIYLFEHPERTHRWAELLARSGLAIRSASDLADLLQLVRTGRGKLLLTSPECFEDLSQSLRPGLRDLSIVVVTDSEAEYRAAELLSQGATAVLTEDELEAARLLEILAARLNDLRKAIRAPRQSDGPGFVTLDESGNIVHANPAACEGLGMPLNELVGRPWTKIVPDTNGDEARSVAGRTVHVQPVAGYRRRLLRVAPPGDQLAALGHVFPQLSQLNRLALSGRLLATVVHDLRTPTAYIRANMDLLADLLDRLARTEPKTTDWRRLVEELREVAADSGSGAAHLAEIARLLELGTGLDVDHSPRAVADEVVTLAVQMLRKEIEYRARLHLDLARVPPAAIAHDRLLQILVNLLRNAIDAIEGGVADNELIVRTRIDNDTVVVEVHDSGHGIPDTMRNRLGEPFATTKPPGEGTGLGLYLCRKFLAEAGGAIRFRDRHPRGTVVEVRLPVVQAPALPSDAVAATLRGDQRPLPPQRPARVLIIDDDRLTRTAYSRLLQTVHRAVQADSVDMALDLLADELVDVIICDLMMPKRNGIELWEELSAMAHPLADRIIFVTAGIYDPVVRAIVEQSGRPLLIKPVSESRLFRAIEEVLQGGDEHG